MRALAPAVALAAILAWIAAAPPRAAERPPTPRAVTLDERRFDYLEDEPTGRVLAEIRARLERQGGDAVLRVTASAIGARVDPVPGWQGVRGSNRITAEEIASISANGRLCVETDVDGAAARRGSARTGRRGRIPERRIGADGSIDVTAQTAAEYPLELIAETAPLGAGVHRTRLVLDGRPRLEIVTTTRGADGRILEIRAIDEHVP
jgi:hypothetical protein